MKLPEPIAGWQEYYNIYRKFIVKHGRMSGAEADAMVMPPIMSAWVGNQDIGDLLVAPHCAHIYRLHRFCAYGVLRRIIRGKTPDKVFYYLPKRGKKS